MKNERDLVNRPVSESDLIIRLTRREHDAILDLDPDWMRETFARLRKKWAFWGVTVLEPKGSGLATRLNAVRDPARLPPEPSTGA